MDFRRGYPRPPGFLPRNFGSMHYYEIGNNSFGMGRGYGISGPSRMPLFPQTRQSSRHPLRARVKAHPCIPFLISCGVAPKYAQNLPFILMEIMEPHFCGVCDRDLPNFEEAKDHYLSKGHYKKQKKFIADESKEPEYPPTNCPVWKVPLKSRDVYCELCDVHITSKVHADSHYAGKSHKAIVYGRKPPKNKLLLCEPMSKRVTKLLRREKKTYSDAKEAEKEEVVKPAEVAKPEPKPVNPDYYCDVCRTSVTSSEQMIMHRNGKRHLLKEKQYILKSMTGKPDKQLLNLDLVHDLKQEMEDLRNQLQNAHIEIASLNSEVTTLKTEGKETNDIPAKRIQGEDDEPDKMEVDTEDQVGGENNTNGGENLNEGNVGQVEEKNIAVKVEKNDDQKQTKSNGQKEETVNVQEEEKNNGLDEDISDKNEWGKDPGEEWGPDDL